MAETAPIDLAERVLGKGIDKRAIKRLFELAPDAQVHVRHHRPIEMRRTTYRDSSWTVIAHGSRRTLDAYREKELSNNTLYRLATHGGKTEVSITLGNQTGGDDRPVSIGYANCSSLDAYCRETGRVLAFRRALHLLPRVLRSKAP